MKSDFCQLVASLINDRLFEYCQKGGRNKNDDQKATVMTVLRGYCAGSVGDEERIRGSDCDSWTREKQQKTVWGCDSERR